MFANSDGLHWWLQGSGFSVSIPLLEFAGAQTLTAFAFTCLQRESCKSAGWLLLAYIIMTMILYKHSRVGMEAASMIVFSVGFVVERLGFCGRVTVGNIIAGYWPLVVLFCGWLAIPFVHGVSDLESPENRGIRLRWTLITTIMLLAFICAGDRMQDPCKIFSRFPGLNRWVVFLYMSHVAVHRLLPSPFNWWLLACSILPFLCLGADASPAEMQPVLINSKRAQEV